MKTSIELIHLTVQYLIITDIVFITGLPIDIVSIMYIYMQAIW